MGSTMNGQLLYIFAVAILDAAILSWVALHWYRRTVSRRMRPENGDTPARGADLRTGVQWSDAEGTSAERVDAEGVDAEGAGAEVQVAVFRAEDDSAAKGSVRDWPAGWRRIAAGYCVGAALFSAVITTAVLSGMPSPPLSAIFGTWWIHAWPVVPTLILLLLLDRRGALGVVATYLLAGSVALAILTLLVQASRWSFSSAPLTNMFWLTAGILLTAYLPLSTTSSDLPDRLARIDVRPDPDGRFRINELYCAARTWQETLGELLTLNDVVLMDLRGFTRNNAGCVFELERLVAQMSADSIVLVCDKTTDYKELSKLLAEAWRRAAGGASAPHGAALTLVTIERNSRAALDALMGRLLGRGEPHRVLTLSELAAFA